jgi:serine/threonine-protein kinase
MGRPDGQRDAGHWPYGPDLAPGLIVDKYVVEDQLGRGGFATVYRVRHTVLGRPAALKVLHAHLVHSPQALKRLLREARAANRIRHPNIVDIYDFGDLPDGRPYFVMEWLEGRTLAEHLHLTGPFSLPQLLELAEELCDALAAAHQVGVVHRDLKAENVILLPAGAGLRVKLIDFSIAKLLEGDGHAAASRLTESGVHLGTPICMAPEQIRGEPVDARTDIYGLGVLLYEMATGRPPFEGATDPDTEQLHLYAEPPLASQQVAAAAPIDTIIRRCLQKHPAERFPSVPEVLGALRRALGESDGGEPPQSTGAQG